MANKRISDLDNLGTTPDAGDIVPITDVSDTVTSGNPNGTTKGVTFSDLTNHLATQVSLGNHESLTSAVHGISAFGATLVDDADAGTARTTLELGTAATTASSDYATFAQGTTADSAVQPTDSIDVLADVDTSTVAPTDGQALVWDNTAGQWEPGPAGASNLDDLSDVTITSAQNEDVIKFNGTSFVNGQISVDVDTPLNTALRGTPSPHIGAYPNQSFKVIDNPYKSVMVVADQAGNLKLLNSLGVNNIAVGFSVVEDGTEPDIEVVSGSETYSVISGDSDTKGANGLPFRQGFNNPDIGANPAPILISGGTIA